MTWNLEGLIVEGQYLNEYPVAGKVELSRVAYGGDVKHHIVLTEPLTVYGAVRDRVILSHTEIQRVRSH